MSTPAPARAKVSGPATPTPSRGGVLQRSCACGQHTGGGQCEHCRAEHEGRLQRSGDGRGAPGAVPDVVHEALDSPGHALDPATRAFMEPRFGYDFSRVRVHTDPLADESARAVDALAYTVGPDVVFAAGRYAPETDGGRELLAHELAHVRQQGGAGPPASHNGQGLTIDDPQGASEREAQSTASEVARGGSAGAASPAAPSSPVAALLSRTTAGAVVGGIVGAAGGALLGSLLGPVGAVVGGLVGAGLGAFLGDKVGDALSGKKKEEEKSSLEKVLKLLSTGLFDWKVTEAEAHQVLAILLGLAPLELFEVVQAIRRAGKWATFVSKVPGPDSDRLVELNERIDPETGYLMPGDVVHLEMFSPHDQAERPLEIPVSASGFQIAGAIPLDVVLVGLKPQAAVDILATKFGESEIGDYDHLMLTVVARGGSYGAQSGATKARLPFQATISATPGALLNQKRRKFLDFYRTIQLGPNESRSVTDFFLQETLNHLDQYPDPESLLVAARSQVELVKPPPVRAFLDLAKSKLADVANPKTPEAEKDRTRTTLKKYQNWIDAHFKLDDFDKYNPIDIWGSLEEGTFKAEVKAAGDKFLREAAEKHEDERISSPEVRKKIDDAIKVIGEKILQPKQQDAERVEAKSDQFGYLVWVSEEEKAIRRGIATAMLNDILSRAKDPDFTKTPAVADVVAWLDGHHDAYMELLLAQANPKTERYEIKIDIPAWQTAIEVGIGFIPIVGTIVGGIEVVTGHDMFGNPLSTTDRAIIAAALLLPAVGKIFKLGKAAVTASRISKAYNLSARESEAVFKAYAQIKPGSAGFRLLEGAEREVKAGTSVKDPEKLKQLETLFKDMGLTDEETARALSERPKSPLAGVGENIDKQAEREIDKLGAMDPNSRERIRSNPDLRRALAESELAAKVFKKCASDCFPPEMKAEQIRRMEDILRKLQGTGDVDEALLRDYLYKNRDNLDKAITDVSTRKEARTFNDLLDFFANRGGKVERVPSAEETAAWVKRSHDIGVDKGYEAAVKSGLKDLPSGKWANPIQVGGFDQGFDHIMADGPTFYIVEYKGGGSPRLSEGQMSRDWVVKNIRRLFAEGGPQDKALARDLAKALGDGKLEGRVFKTKIVNGVPQPTSMEKIPYPKFNLVL
jgi:hypothetical protein